jgi:hypothetical protein
MNVARIAMIFAFSFFVVSVFAQSPQSNDGNSYQLTTQINHELPKWLRLSGSYRMRFEDQSGLGFKDSSDAYLLARFWLGATIQPAAWLSFFGQAQDARMFFNNVLPSASPNRNTWDLHQAWVQLGGTEKYPVTLRLGRQELNFGEQRLVGSAPWLNAPRVFDAALATFRLPALRVDIFASSVVNASDEQPDHHKQGTPFYGIYGSLGRLVRKSTIEPYYFWRLAPAGYSAPYANGASGHLNQKTVGFRWVGSLPAKFDYGAEMARQYGSLGTNSISAWAGHWIIAKSFDTRLKPRILFEYNYASGNGRPTSNSLGTFDQLYPSGHDKIGETDQVGWRNIRDIRTGAEFKATRKLTFSGIYHNFWLADAHDGLYAASGAVVARSLTGAAGTHVGQELDAAGTYSWNKAVQVGLGYGHVFTSEFLNKTTSGKDYNYPYITAAYQF